MEPIQINVSVKLDENTQAFLGMLFGKIVPAAPAAEQKPAPAAEQKPAPAVEQKPAPAVEQKPAPAVEQKPAPAAEQKPAPAAEQKPAPAAEQKPAVTIDSLRELAMTKMNGHRAEIKEKLTELGAPSITKLGQDKYQEMFDFLKSLS